MAVTLVQLLQTMVKYGGSDLHIAAASPPMMRVRGDMMKITNDPLTQPEVEAMVSQITSEEQRMEIATQKGADFAFKATGVGIFRVNVFTQRLGNAIVMRILTEAPPTLESLKAPAICKTVTSYANGLVLITGPTGSGKSTTLAAMLNMINETTAGHILTLEDPIEFQHVSKKCMVNQRALGAHFPTFGAAMKAALREDPDVILVGEMRDPETVALALKAAETGHLVFSTLHTNSASKTIDRIINSFPAEEQPQIRTVLSETLKAVISQKLIPTADGKRRICVHDILINTPAVGNLIREGKTVQLLSAMQTGKTSGMLVMDKTILDLVNSGEIKGEDAYEAANDKAPFMKWAPKEAQAAETAPAGPAPGTPGYGQSGSMAAAGTATGAKPAVPTPTGTSTGIPGMPPKKVA